MKRNILIIISVLFCLNAYSQVNSSEPVREDIEWLDVWIPNTNDKGLPRVLLIGNSITRAYNKEVENLLKGKAFVARMSTSKSIGDPGLLAEINLVMSYFSFDIVHFNNGLHGWRYTEDEYKNAFPDFFDTIKKNAPTATYIWATTTPMFDKASNMEKMDPKIDRIIERNRIAAEYFKGKPVITNDLYTLAINHPEYYIGSDGVHHVKEGVTALANQVANSIIKALDK